MPNIINRTVIVGRKPETSQPRRMSGDAPSSYGQAPLTPSSSSTGPSEPLAPSAEEAGRVDSQHNLSYNARDEFPQDLNDLTPVMAVQERPTDQELDDQSHTLPLT